MKITTLLIFISTFNLLAESGYSQDDEMSLKLAKTNTISNVISEIEKTTDYVFIYNEDVIPTLRNEVNVDINNQSLDEILNRLLNGTDLAYSLSSKQITLYKDKSRKVETNIFSTKSLSILQQTKKNITGTVVDERGEPIIGANIIEKGTSNGTITDLDGKFSLSIPNNAILKISYIGYLEQEINTKGQTTLKVVLNEDTKTLDELVVIGYGQVSKSDVTGSVISIKPDELNRGSITKTSDLLLGKVAGLQITMPSGSPTSSGTIRIRQGASLNASNSPLIVVDGVAGESLDYINSEDIENITVLKDASSSAIYGSRGANGVIIITTKKGAASGDKTISPLFNYRSDFSVNQNVRFLDVYNPDEFRTEFIKRYPDYGPLLGNASTDWQNEIYRIGLTQKHTLSATGAFPNMPYRVSFGYQNDNGTIKNSKKDMATIAINIAPSFLNNHLKADITFKETYTYIPASSSPVESAAFMDPTAPVYATYPNNMGLGYYMYGADEKGTKPTDVTNPVASVDLAMGYSRNYRTAGNLNLSYKIHGFEDLTLIANLGIVAHDYYNTRNVLDNSPETWDSYGGKGIGVHAWDNSSSKISTREYYANYKHAFADIHNIDATFGHTYERFHSSWENSPTWLNDSEEVYAIGSDGASERTLSSYFGRVNYNLTNKYLFTFTMRADASSRFAPETRWGYFPSGAFAWKINEEKFMKNFRNLSNLKLRLSYGQTGQQDINNDYAYQASYRSSTDDARYRFGDTFYTTYRPNAFDRRIQWEVSSTYNAGLEWSLYNSRIYGSLDVYKRFTDNLLMKNVRVSAGSNFADTLDQNIGDMESNGVEFSIGAMLLNRNDLQWTFSANFAYNQSTITKLTAYESNAEDTYIKTGSIGSSRYAQIHKMGNAPNTFFLAKQVYDEAGKPMDGVYYNPKYDPSVPGSEEFVKDDSNDANKWDTGKSSLVPYYGGFSTAVKYKDWDFGVNGHFAFGQYVFWETACRGSNESLYDTYGLNPKNSLINTPEWLQEHRFSDHWLYKGDYFKLDNITAGYTFENIWNSKSTLRISIGVQNVFVITKYPGIDPESYSGIDGSSYPRPRMYMFTANLKF